MTMKPAKGQVDPSHSLNHGAIETSDPTSKLERELWDLLNEIPDPHIPVSIVELSMIYEVDITDGVAEVEMTFPCMGCPAYDMIQNDIESCLVVHEAVDDVEVNVVWDPVWSKDMLTDDAREKMREAGVGL